MAPLTCFTRYKPFADSGWPLNDNDAAARRFALENNIRFDYEIITANYLGFQVLRDFIQQILLPQGFGYFGHGHTHINHDELPYNEAYQSFRQCYHIMQELGLKPVSYAYPGGYGHEPETRQALEAAGFLSGRKVYFREQP